MGKIFKKKQLVLTALVVLLGVAVYINWYYTRPENQVDNNLTESTTQTGNLGEAEFVDGQTPEGEEYFAAVKLNRSTAHDEALETLKLLIKDDATPEEVAAAADTIEKFSNRLKSESDIELLVKAKTGSECVAVINEDRIDIVVSSSVLNDNTVLQIKEIVMNNSDIPPENITITGVK